MGPFGNLVSGGKYCQVAERIPIPSVRHTIMGRGGLKVVLAIARNPYGVLKHLFHQRLLHSVSSKLYIFSPQLLGTCAVDHGSIFPSANSDERSGLTTQKEG